jgi:hypothetical protein
MTLNDEEKSQLRTRIKIEGTIDKTVFEEFKRIYELEIQKAEAEDRAQPSISHILEMLLRKGIKAYKLEKGKTL